MIEAQWPSPVELYHILLLLFEQQLVQSTNLILYVSYYNIIVFNRYLAQKGANDYMPPWIV